MTRTRKQLDTASHFASAFSRLLIQEAVLRDGKDPRLAKLSDSQIDILYRRVGQELGIGASTFVISASSSSEVSEEMRAKAEVA